MNTPKLTKKQKKGLAFRERKGKKSGDASLTEDFAIPQADHPVEGAEPTPPLDIQTGRPVNSNVQKSIVQTKPSTTIQSESTQKSKKRKRTTEDDVKTTGTERSTEAKKMADGIGNSAADKSKPKNKKRKVEGEGEPSEDAPVSSIPTKQRFILFVGNLKYTTSMEVIKDHFSKCDPPPQVRLLTPKPKFPGAITAKSKGCAFLEFSHRNALQQGLKLHGSTLDSRRINVELTAGGGGKSEQRVEKVKARNKHLIEERKTHVQKTAAAGGEAEEALILPPQRHSTTSGLEEKTQKPRTWTIPTEGEESGRGGAKKRGKKGKPSGRSWGTGANSIAVG